MRTRLLGAALAALLFAPATPAQEPDLAALAKQEKKRRKTVQGPTKIITTDDLKGGGGPASPEPDTTGTANTAVDNARSATGAAGAKSEDEEREERQQKWRDGLHKANDDVTRLTDLVGKLQSSLNDISQNVYSATRTNRVASLEQAQKGLAAAQQKVSELEDEGRRNGYR